jgi:hypothetical protein
LLGLACAMANLDLAAPTLPILPNPHHFHSLSRASRPSRNQLRNSSQTPRHTLNQSLPEQVISPENSRDVLSGERH